MFKHKRIAIDFDGTLFCEVSNIWDAFDQELNLQPQIGAAETTRWLRKIGFELLIFTCRPDYHRSYMEKQLSSAKIEHDYILFYTKPRVDLYIDDKGLRFKDWSTTRNFIESNLYQTKDKPIIDPSPDTLFEQHLRESRLKKFQKLLPSHQVKNILDVGCARGQTNWKHLPYSVDGFDINKQFLKIALELGNYNKLFDTLPLVTKYDAITMFGVLEHIENPLLFLKKFTKTNKIMLTVPNGASFHRLLGKKLGIINNLNQLNISDINVGHHHYFTEDTFQTLLDKFCKQTGYMLYEYGSHCLKFGTNPQMSQFLDVAGVIDDVAEDIGITGNNNFRGAELYALLERES